VGTNLSCNGGWKERLNYYHHHGVKVDYFGGTYNPNILVSAVRMISGDVPALEFPAKSYVVAICYADHIAQTYQENFIEVLSYPTLLYDDDHFAPYSEETMAVYATLTPLVLSPEFRSSELYSVIMGYCKEELGLPP